MPEPLVLRKFHELAGPSLQRNTSEEIVGRLLSFDRETDLSIFKSLRDAGPDERA